MRIFFHGLVCHTAITGNTQQIAALPAATGHKATLSYKNCDIDGADDDETGNTCQELLDCFDTDLGRGLPTKLEIGDVPQLTRTTTGTAAHPSPELKCLGDTSIIRSIFFLPPGGRLYCDCYFDEEVNFNVSPYGPMPEIVIYAVRPMASKVTFTLRGGMTVALKPTADVTIANVCKTKGMTSRSGSVSCSSGRSRI